MRHETPNTFVVIVDTEQYAGNFERDMVAFITGQIGECEVGQEQAEIAARELDPAVREWFDENVLQLPDDHGCHRPATISPTPGWYNNGSGSHRKLKSNKDPRYPAYLSVEFQCRKEPSREVKNIIAERAMRFCAEHCMFGGDPAPLTFVRIRMETRTVIRTLAAEFTKDGAWT